MPVPSAAISVPICSDESILSNRTRSTLRIFPRSGSTAWNSRLRPCFALPPALSPSTRNSSDFAGSRSWQSASLPGKLDICRGFFRLSSRALRAASRAIAEHALDRGPHLGRDQLVLGLGGELRIRHLAREHRGQALAGILAGERHL